MVRIRSILALPVLGALLLAPVAPVGAAPAPAADRLAPLALPAAPPDPTTATVASGLDIPWDVAFLPDGRMVVSERPGRVRVYADGSPGAALVRTVTVPDVRAEGESGVMGLAVDTDFARFPYVYVCASRQYPGSGGWVNQVLRYRVADDGSWSGPGIVLGGMAANRTHNGCALEMDDAGLLWVGMGDAAQASLAQDRSSRNGKVLRVTRSGGVPADNPVIGGRRDVVYSMGHRNPQGLALRPGTTQVYEVEHGPDVDDEVNLLRPGRNYGWPCYTGASRPRSTAGCGAASSYEPPLWASGGSTVASSGGSVLRGSAWADWEGDLVVSTLKQSDLRRMTIGSGGTSLREVQTLFDGRFGRLRASVPGPGGRLYLTTSGGGGDDRVVRVSAGATSLTRVAGSDRYATAAAVSQRSHPSGADDVLVATGTDYPDALTAGAVGGRLGMPVLLTASGRVPQSTRDELRRLAPRRVWLLGGPAAVSEQVRRDLAALTSTGSATRVSGTSRYGTAAAASARWSSAGVPTALVATGAGYADALSAGPAAAVRGAPVLLTGRSTLPGATREVLQRLRPGRVEVIGGPAAVSDAVLAELRGLTSGSVVRVGGANRYAVARAVADRFFTTADAYLASGRAFPDGLTGGAAAGRAGAPVLLATSAVVPADTGRALLDLAPRRTVVVGGTSSIGSGVYGSVRRLVGVP